MPPAAIITDPATTPNVGCSLKKTENHQTCEDNRTDDRQRRKTIALDDAIFSALRNLFVPLRSDRSANAIRHYRLDAMRQWNIATIATA
jgi:hypothetical protein